MAAGSLGVPGLEDWPKDFARLPTIASVLSEGVEGLGGLERMFSCRRGGVMRGRFSIIAGSVEMIAGGKIRAWMAEIWERQMLNVWVQSGPVGRSMSVKRVVRRGEGLAEM